MKRNGQILAVDIGSTFTKVAAFDLDKEELTGTAQSPTTVETDITIGLNKAIDNLQISPGGQKLNIRQILACSSAAGGLRIAVVGLVNELTTKAANEAALGAGAKVVLTCSYYLTAEDVKKIEGKTPDLILLTGGTDGGNEDVILHNASLLSSSRLNVPVIIAGNTKAASGVQSIFNNAGKFSIITDNVLPEINILDVEPARSAIRNIFMERITHAKGLDKAESFIGRIIMPTPMAVLKGAALLADGTEDEQGLGELMVVDVGGATTDVYSIAHGYPSRQDIMVKGIPEPYEKRTVEGDLGIRYNAESILDIAGKASIMEKIKRINNAELSDINIELKKAVENLAEHTSIVPHTKEEFMIDVGLASSAVEIATGRHAGTIKELSFPTGMVKVQSGKDLTRIEYALGTGGVFVYGKEAATILRSLCGDPKHPENLRPKNPKFYLDERYILYAAGLLAEVSPLKALRIIKKYIKIL
jgi:uncharacterized protein (TIGR01319 family)